ncbi:hypothetical protein A165_18215 [Vibrio tasmaniensis ZS-17]|nr:hypothetical protein A165_18215 [Vibrio tasmaniensis ZS-17]
MGLNKYWNEEAGNRKLEIGNWKSETGKEREEKKRKEKKREEKRREEKRRENIKSRPRAENPNEELSVTEHKTLGIKRQT